MFESSKWYRLHDTVRSEGAIEIPKSEAAKWNAMGFGIFFSVNVFEGRRLAKNLVKINAWYCDYDGDKPEALKLLLAAPLKPSLIVETRNGYHMYYFARDATPDNYKLICNGVSDHFHCKDRLSDVTRILRTPGYYHHKTSEPWLVRALNGVWSHYSEADMMAAFDVQPLPPGEDLRSHFSSAAVMRNVFGLAAVSGTEYVNYDKYTLRNNHNGTFQILVNGKSTGCWLDRLGYIGSTSGGGPTIRHWLSWYGKGHDNVDAAMSYINDTINAKQGG